jgi:hypothetical protein
LFYSQNSKGVLVDQERIDKKKNRKINRVLLGKGLLLFDVTFTSKMNIIPRQATRLC